MLFHSSDEEESPDIRGLASPLMVPLVEDGEGEEDASDSEEWMRSLGLVMSRKERMGEGAEEGPLKFIGLDGLD